MNIGVIGSTGFVGKSLMKCLGGSPMVDKVIGTSRRMGVDAKDYDAVYDFIVKNDISHVVNLAAYCGGIGLNKTSPFDLWYESTLIGANVLKACIDAEVTKVVMIGTVCSYSAETPVPFKEEYLMRYGDPEITNRAYGLSKLNSLYGGSAAKKQYGTNVVNLIPVNMYGEHDNFDYATSHVIPAIIRKINDAKTDGVVPIFWGDGSATREFLHVEDCCDAILNSLLKLNDDGFYNVGSGQEISIKDLVDEIAAIFDYNDTIIFDDSMPNGQLRRCLDTSKLYNAIGWNAKISLPDGLKRTVNWFLNQ
jgi:GDP-L-fucose synthase